MTVPNGDQAWVRVKDVLHRHSLTQEECKAVSRAVADELVQRGHLHTTEAARRAIDVEVRAVRQALR